MQNTNEIRAHIAAVKQTRKITNAMHLVASSRLKKVMSHIEYNNAYFSRVQAVPSLPVQSPHQRGSPPDIHPAQRQSHRRATRQKLKP